MTGSYERVDAPGAPRSMRFSIRARAGSALAHLRDGRTELEGTLDMEGLAHGVPIEGTLTIRPVRGRIIRYEFEFAADDGQRYRFDGQKDIEFTNLRESMTTLRGSVYDASGRAVASAELRFELGTDLVPFLRSWRPT